MTTQPFATREPGSSRFVTQDAAGGLRTLGSARAGWPILITQAGAGTGNDAVSWDSQPALILDLSVAVGVDTGALGGGTATIQVFAQGQSAYSGADGWITVVPPIAWNLGQTPFLLAGLLGRAVVLTGTPVSPSTRLRVVVTGADEVRVMGMAAPVAANPTC